MPWPRRNPGLIYGVEMKEFLLDMAEWILVFTAYDLLKKPVSALLNKWLKR